MMKKDKMVKFAQTSAILGTAILLVSGCDKNMTSKKDNESSKNSDIVSNSNENNSVSMSSKVGNFVNYSDYTYFWKLNNNSRNSTELFGNWTTDVPINSTVNELIRVDKTGKQEVIYKGSGMGQIVIANDHIYIMALKDNDYYIYSMSLEGKDIKELGKGTIKYSDNNMIVGIINRNNDIGIYTIDSKSNTYKIVNDSATLLTVNNGVIYYGINNAKQIKIGSVKDGTDNGTMATLDYKVFKSFGDSSLQVEGISIDDNINIYYGYRDGSAAMIQELAKATMNFDGSNLKTVLVEQKVLDNCLNEGKVYISNNEIKYMLNGKETNIMSTSEFAKNNKLKLNDETLLVINGSNVYDDVAYAIIDYGVHNSKEDIGWRYAYNRTKTIVTQIDLHTNEMTILYQY